MSGRDALLRLYTFLYMYQVNCFFRPCNKRPSKFNKKFIPLYTYSQETFVKIKKISFLGMK
jgi:hypothetical protein